MRCQDAGLQLRLCLVRKAVTRTNRIWIQHLSFHWSLLHYFMLPATSSIQSTNRFDIAYYFANSIGME
jgi:hypothetical protein